VTPYGFCLPVVARGGTQVGHGAQAGPVRILGESATGAGLRRIEALTGADALRHTDHERRPLEEVTRLVGARPNDVIAIQTKRLTTLADAEKALAVLRQRELEAMGSRLAQQLRILDELSSLPRPSTSAMLLCRSGCRPAGGSLQQTRSGDHQRVVSVEVFEPGEGG
jgi:hypothetical protein